MERLTQLDGGILSSLAARTLMAALLLGACSGDELGETASGTDSGSDSQTSNGSTDSNGTSATQGETDGETDGETESGTGGETGETGETGEPDVPHALGSIVLGETHAAAGGSSTPFVSAGFVPNTENLSAKGCFDNVSGCQIAMIPDCGDGCDSNEYCTFNDSCASTCTRLCDASCGDDEVCYFPAPNNPSCKKIEDFDAGALTFVGTPLPINLFPPYSFSGESGSPFAPKGDSTVQASGATNAGFEAFEAGFTGTEFMTTSPSLSDLGLSKVFGSGALPVKWKAGDGDVTISVVVTADDFSSGVLTCEADDKSGSLDIPRDAILAAIDGGDVAGMTVSIERRRVDTTKGLTTTGTLTGVTVEPVGWVNIVTVSTETHTFEGCASNELFCGDECIDVDYDNDNCGSCGNSCLEGDSCEGGTCVGFGVCNACLEDSMDGDCKSAYDACEADPDCSGLTACLQGCDSTECQNQCGNDFPDGIELYNAAIACVCEDACYDECYEYC